MFRSYTYKDVLTRASTTLQIIDDTTLYKAQIFSSNGNIFNINEKSSDLTLSVRKGLEDITSQFTDIVWSRFHSKAGHYEEDLKWGEQHYGKTHFTLHRDDILEKANIQVAVYADINGEKTLVAADYISFTDINDLKGSDTPPENPKDGDMWLDTSVVPPRLMVWDDKLKEWVEVFVAGNDRRNLLRNSNFYKKNFDFWATKGDPVLEIESLNSKRWARIYNYSPSNDFDGISQIITGEKKSSYAFQMICGIYIQSTASNKGVLVRAFSIDKNQQRTLISENVFNIEHEIRNYNFTFMSLDDTEQIEIAITGQPEDIFDFILTNTKLEKGAIPTEWEIAIEDIQDALDNKVGNTPDEIFNSLTDDGKRQGIYIDTDEDGNQNYYFNASYIKSGYIKGDLIDAKNLTVWREDGKKTLEIDQYGNVTLRGNIEITAGDTFVPPATVEDIAYKVEILSSNGLVFYNGQIETRLCAKVYKGKEDITHELDAVRFQWTKTFEDGTEDLIWNENYGRSVKEVLITKNDVNSKSTFTCAVMSDEEYLKYLK